MVFHFEAKLPRINIDAARPALLSTSNSEYRARSDTSLSWLGDAYTFSEDNIESRATGSEYVRGDFISGWSLLYLVPVIGIAIM